MLNLNKSFGTRLSLPGFVAVGTIALVLAGTVSVAAPKTATPAKAPAAKTQPVKESAKTAAVDAAASPAAYEVVGPLDLVKDPDKYMNHYVAFEGTFNRFADLALDYKKAFRDSRDYVSMLILRPDVKNHDIPLSELKLFFPRKKSEEVTDMDSGDIISIRGQVFSDALGDPWVEITDVKVVQKKETEKKKGAPECC